MDHISTEEKFYSAVELIKNLPKSGSINPSNDTKLKFYSYFKQATQGPCDISKPGFWDIINRAKWDAWNRLGNMTKEEAMIKYVQEFVTILEETPIENLDDPDVLEEYVQLMGPYIAYAPKEIQEKHRLMNGKPPLNNNSEDYTSSLKDSKRVLSDNEDSHSVNGNGMNGGNESDCDEFSDTLERVNETEWDEEAVKGQSIRRARGGCDSNRGDKNSPMSGQGRGATSSNNPSNAASAMFGVLPPGSAGPSSGVGGGGRRNGGDVGPQPASDISQQLTLSILQMHQTMEQVVQRLNALETLLRSQNQVQPRRRRWSIFGVHPTVAFLIFAWPFIVQWLVFVIRKRQRRA